LALAQAIRLTNPRPGLPRAAVPTQDPPAARHAHPAPPASRHPGGF